MTPEQQHFLARYREHHRSPGYSESTAIALEKFGDTPELIDECARLINAGIKQASCSWIESWRAEDEPLPSAGQLTVVLDSRDAPVCIIALTSVTICRFDEVTPAFAALEGEGDGSYGWWHREHVRFFQHEAARLGVEFTETCELVLERFEKVFP